MSHTHENTPKRSFYKNKNVERWEAQQQPALRATLVTSGSISVVRYGRGDSRSRWCIYGAPLDRWDRPPWGLLGRPIRQEPHTRLSYANPPRVFCLPWVDGYSNGNYRIQDILLYVKSDLSFFKHARYLPHTHHYVSR